MAEPRVAHPWFAALYDRMSAPMERGFMGAVRGDLVGTAGGRVLELGCGTGANFAYYRNGATEVVATEPDPHMLERARKRATDVGRSIDIRQVPAEALPFPDASFDTVVSTLVLCTVDEPAKALAEVKRVLRPGGEFRFCEHVRAQNTVGALVQDVITPLWRHLAGGCHPNRDLLGLIQGAGFAAIRSQYVEGPAIPVFVKGVAAT